LKIILAFEDPALQESRNTASEPAIARLVQRRKDQTEFSTGGSSSRYSDVMLARALCRSIARNSEV